MPDNPYLVVGQPSYGAPLVDFAGALSGGQKLGQSARQGLGHLLQPNQQQQPQWPQGGAYQWPQGQNPTQQQMAQGAMPPRPQGQQPPGYAANLASIFGINMGGGGQPQSPQSPGAQSPTQWGGAPSPYTNFSYPGSGT